MVIAQVTAEHIAAQGGICTHEDLGAAEIGSILVFKYFQRDIDCMLKICSELEQACRAGGQCPVQGYSDSGFKMGIVSVG